MSEVIWDLNQGWQYLCNEATEEELLEMAEDLGYDREEFAWESYDEDDDEDYDYEELAREEGSRYNLEDLIDTLWDLNRDAFITKSIDKFNKYILPGIVNQINHNFLLIDNKVVEVEYYNRWDMAIISMIPEGLDESQICVNEYGEVEGWFTLPEDESGLYKLARHIPAVKNTVQQKISRNAGLEGRDIWIKTLFDCINNNKINWSDNNVKKFLVPIINPLAV